MESDQYRHLYNLLDRSLFACQTLPTTPCSFISIEGQMDLGSRYVTKVYIRFLDDKSEQIAKIPDTMGEHARYSLEAIAHVNAKAGVMESSQ